MMCQLRSRPTAMLSLFMAGSGVLSLSALAQSALPLSANASYPARRDADLKSRFEAFQQQDKERIRPYLHSIPWLADPGWIESRQNELFAYFRTKLKHETLEPFVPPDGLMEWRTERHHHAYSTELENGRLQVFPSQNAAWDLIVEDLRVCGSILRSDAPEARRKEAFAVIAADMPLIGAVMGDAHAARLTYESFLLPYLDLANPQPGLWPSQAQILLDCHIWLLKDETAEKTSDISKMMIRYGDEWYDPHYREVLGDVTRYAYGDYLKSHGEPQQAIRLWREIKAPNLLNGAKTLYEQAELEQKHPQPSKP